MEAESPFSFKKLAERLARGEVPFDKGGPVLRDLALVLRELEEFIARDRGALIAIKGDWGTGKTSYLHAIKDYFQEYRGFPVVFFEAWKYQDESHPLVPLLAQMGRVLEKGEGKAKEWARTLFKCARVVAALSAGAATRYLGFAPGGFKDLEDAFRFVEAQGDKLFEEQLFFDRAMDRLRSQVGSILEQWKANNKTPEPWEVLFQQAEVDLPEDQAHKAFILIIDDLDRCLPEKAFKLLEAVRFYLTLPQSLVVMGINDRVLARYVERHYGVRDPAIFSGEEFMDKVFHWSVELSRAGWQEAMVSYPELGRDFVPQELRSLYLPYRKWVRIKKRIAAMELHRSSPSPSQVTLLFFKECYPKCEPLLRRCPPLKEKMVGGELTDAEVQTLKKEMAEDESVLEGEENIEVFINAFASEGI